MAFELPQTTYQLDPDIAVPGMPYSASSISADDIVSYPAAVAVPFGVLCELSPTGKAGGTTVQPCQSTHASFGATVLKGVSIYDPAREQVIGGGGGGYAAGDMVPLLRRGKIYGAYDGGGTLSDGAVLNVWHSSDGTHKQGVFTMSAPATTSGAEIEALATSIGQGKATASASVCVVELNLPATGN